MICDYIEMEVVIVFFADLDHRVWASANLGTKIRFESIEAKSTQ